MTADDLGPRRPPPPRAIGRRHREPPVRPVLLLGGGHDLLRLRDRLLRTARPHLPSQRDPPRRQDPPVLHRRCPRSRGAAAADGCRSRGAQAARRELEHRRERHPEGSSRGGRVRSPLLLPNDGSPAPPLADGEIYLNAWAAEDLGVGEDFPRAPRSPCATSSSAPATSSPSAKKPSASPASSRSRGPGSRPLPDPRIPRHVRRRET